MPVRILIVDDHPLVREGLKGLLSAQTDFVICGEAETAAEAREMIGRVQPHVAIVDLTLKDGNGIELIKELKARFASVKMLVVSMHDESLFAERAVARRSAGLRQQARS